MRQSEVLKKHCIVLTKDSENDINEAKKLLIRQGADEFTLNKSAIIRKAIKLFVRTLKGDYRI